MKEQNWYPQRADLQNTQQPAEGFVSKRFLTILANSKSSCGGGFVFTCMKKKKEKNPPPQVLEFSQPGSGIELQPDVCILPTDRLITAGPNFLTGSVSV